MTLKLATLRPDVENRQSLLVTRILQGFFPNIIPIHIRTLIVLAHMSKINQCTQMKQIQTPSLYLYYKQINVLQGFHREHGNKRICGIFSFPQDLVCIWMFQVQPTSVKRHLCIQRTTNDKNHCKHFRILDFKFLRFQLISNFFSSPHYLCKTWLF